MSNQKYYHTLILFFISLFFSFYLISYFEKKERNIEKDRARYIAKTQIEILKNTINTYLYDTKIIEMLVIKNNGSTDGFYRISKELYYEDKAIRGIQIAPGGVITKSFPYVGNEKGLINLFTNPLRKKSAEYARDTKKLTLTGPFKLFQEGIGLIARRPIFLENSKGNQNFWGFSIIILNFQETLKNSRVEKLKSEGYNYKITKNSLGSPIQNIVTENIINKMSNPEIISFTIANDKWKFYIEPIHGWNKKQLFYLRYFLGIFISLLISCLSYAFIYINSQREKMTLITVTDHLTKLFNNRKFEQIANEYIEKNLHFSIFYFDLNDFKLINDNYGHGVGDLYLIEISQRILTTIGHNGIVFRIGGDEFSAIIKNMNTAIDCLNLINQIKQSVEIDFKIKNILIKPSISCGYSIFSIDSNTYENLIKIADKRMYLDKVKYKTSKR